MIRKEGEERKNEREKSWIERKEWEERITNICLGRRTMGATTPASPSIQP
jgi:hypothetical protein